MTSLSDQHVALDPQDSGAVLCTVTKPFTSPHPLRGMDEYQRMFDTVLDPAQDTPNPDQLLTNYDRAVAWARELLELPPREPG